MKLQILWAIEICHFWSEFKLQNAEIIITTTTPSKIFRLIVVQFDEILGYVMVSILVLCRFLSKNNRPIPPCQNLDQNTKMRTENVKQFFGIFFLAAAAFQNCSSFANEHKIRNIFREISLFTDKSNWFHEIFFTLSKNILLIVLKYFHSA